ncbi:MAG: PIN domain-containing protein [Deltaproteobacteria bacterium]|jgi:predicted nucleic acid-binding protein|nr:PIN domain-containing protein [Deltaproteobacteria bacterium]
MIGYILDACALIALLRNEEGANIVEGLIDKANAGILKVSIHKANSLEVYYETIRTNGTKRAIETINEISKLPITIISDISDALFMEAGRLKSLYKVSFADTFALATASTSDSVLVTSERQEMDILDQSEPNITFLWIR